MEIPCFVREYVRNDNKSGSNLIKSNYNSIEIINDYIKIKFVERILTDFILFTRIYDLERNINITQILHYTGKLEMNISGNDIKSETIMINLSSTEINNEIFSTELYYKTKYNIKINLHIFKHVYDIIFSKANEREQRTKLIKNIYFNYYIFYLTQVDCGYVDYDYYIEMIYKTLNELYMLYFGEGTNGFK